MTIRVGVIGAGIMGADHVRNLAGAVSGAAVSLVADLDAGRAAAAAGPAGARSTTDPKALIKDRDVDAVVIASHDSTHADLLLACLDARKPVLCEKPLAPTVEEGRTVVQAEEAVAEELGRSLVSLGFMRRFDPAHTELKRRLEAGEFGDVLTAHCVSRNVRSAPDATNVSAITNSTIHELDSMPWLLGTSVAEVAWVSGRKTSALAPAGLQDPAFMLLRMADGTLVTLELFLNAEYGYSTRLEVVGERGTASFTESPLLEVNLDRRRATEYPADWRPRFADAYRIELKAWIDSLATGAPSPLATARDGLRASEIGAALVASIDAGGAFVPVVHG
ncbi:inositol 2-dehydrogenase [Sinomonas cellulolyticus]|uniref:Gfo/Idh/MocA family oxidoreductase n=1 Tax=Sinomonas cellulolyticus TaxID=2801916 RepID=A0ABS1JY76_9MICC|nr:MULTISPECIES: Gfo/Idh/MocA family oxidoreductase [Sinomonas]MBL0704153.1 Gfo/Idh/MocA family oxidoreductase [Sinomonas cellulolyticus]GHG57996.1 inositol 2-dehydrogenase [Sinomonas sp. KCTC 49339]